MNTKYIKIFLFLQIILSLCWGNAFEPHLKLGTPLNSSQIVEFSKSINNPVECRELIDIPAAYLCLTLNQTLLRQLMGRVSFFVEGKPGQVIVEENNKEFLESDQAQYDGHDIMAKDFRDFYLDLDRKCSLDHKFCANSLEEDLRNDLVQPAYKHHHGKFAVIAIVAQTDFVTEIFSHEILHARFFLNKKYQYAVYNFWLKQVEPEDRKEIIEILNKTYNLKNKNAYFLLLNEFQAYLLEDNSLDDILNTMAIKYEKGLRSYLLRLRLLTTKNIM